VRGLQDVQVLLFIINLLLVGMMAVFVSILPVVTRKTLLFGVRIPESAGRGPEASDLKRRFIATVLAGSVGVAAIAVAQYLIAPDYTLLSTLYFPFLMVALQYAAFIPRWKRVLELKAEKNWITPVPGTVETRSAVEREKLLSFPKGWYLLGLILVLAGGILSLARYPSLPDRIATHWNIAMEPDVWSDKSLVAVLMMPLIALGTVLLMAASNIMVYRMKLQVDAERPALSYAQHRLYRKMMSNALGIVTVSITVFLLSTQLMVLGLWMPSAGLMAGITVALLIICCVPFVYIAVKAGQSGNKLLIPEDELTISSGRVRAPVRAVHPEQGDDRHWKLGLFYYNKDDPAILVEDRFGTNAGLNYARPVALVVSGALALMIAAIYIVVTLVFFNSL